MEAAKAEEATEASRSDTLSSSPIETELVLLLEKCQITIATGEPRYLWKLR